jgi:formylglycine-generating enzyme required for sulfatase activity
MGSAAAEGRENERPQAWIEVDPFYISRTEVTLAQYRQYLAATGTADPFPQGYLERHVPTDDHAVTWVTHRDAEAFCAWMSTLGFGTFRLPTEAEWEKAAKGFSHRAYPWGDRYDGTQSGSKNGEYAPVGSHPVDSSPFGALDMAGNVWEWCRDGYAPDTYARRESPRNPVGPADTGLRVLRSCGWNYDPDTFRCSYRSGAAPDTRSVHIGFRVVRDALPEPTADAPATR